MAPISNLLISYFMIHDWIRAMKIGTETPVTTAQMVIGRILNVYKHKYMAAVMVAVRHTKIFLPSVGKKLVSLLAIP